MAKQQIDDALKTLEEYKLVMSRLIPWTIQLDVALEDACADAARLADRIRELQDELDASMSA